VQLVGIKEETACKTAWTGKLRKITAIMCKIL